MDLLELEKIKKLAIISMFSDDRLMELLVLKGGNALDIVYKAADRASIDLDFSISNNFSQEELIEIEKRIKDTLVKSFREEGYIVFDVIFFQRPKRSTENMKPFWGDTRSNLK